MFTKATLVSVFCLIPTLLFGQRIIESDETVRNSSRKKAYQSSLALKLGFTDALRGEIPVSLEYGFSEQVSVEVGVSYLIKNFWYFSEWGFLAGNDPFVGSTYDIYGSPDASVGVFSKVRFYYDDQFYEGCFFEIEFNDRRYNSTYTYEDFEQPTFMHFTDFSLNWGAVHHSNERFCLEGLYGFGVRNARLQFSEGDNFEPAVPGESPGLYTSQGNTLMLRIGYKLVYLL
ncbi:MAG: hypothetical protein J4F31_01040 [Flavobacteriales bacterium]|nr:hypothetical protein [Flavobacteriales bacterium]